jgi:hypothetical protein
VPPAELRRVGADPRSFFGGIALPGPYRSSGDSEAEKYYHAHDDPALRNVHHVSTIVQPSNQNEISHEVQGKGHLSTSGPYCALADRSVTNQSNKVEQLIEPEQEPL